jgi:hypothetical protein
MFAFSGHKGRFRCKVPQELEAIFYGNYLVPALVNNVNPVYQAGWSGRQMFRTA